MVGAGFRGTLLPPNYYLHPFIQLLFCDLVLQLQTRMEGLILIPFGCGYDGLSGPPSSNITKPGFMTGCEMITKATSVCPKKYEYRMCVG